MRIIHVPHENWSVSPDANILASLLYALIFSSLRSFVKVIKLPLWSNKSYQMIKLSRKRNSETRKFMRDVFMLKWYPARRMFIYFSVICDILLLFTGFDVSKYDSVTTCFIIIVLFYSGVSIKYFKRYCIPQRYWLLQYFYSYCSVA